MAISNNKIIKFGKYYQGGCFLGKEFKTPIEWYVLDTRENMSLILSKYCLDVKPYSDKYEDTTWEKSSIRFWLNNEKDIDNSFILNAFTSDEISRIIPTRIENKGNIDFNVDGGMDTVDKIFFLSIDEFNKYLKNTNMILAAPTKKLSKKKKIYVYNKCKTCYGKASSIWWLRTPGCSKRNVEIVTPDGALYPYSGNVDAKIGLIRVALWIKNN